MWKRKVEVLERQKADEVRALKSEIESYKRMVERQKKDFDAEKERYERSHRIDWKFYSEVWEKYTLSIEAAAYFRIGDHKLRNLINENKNADYLLWNGKRVQIKREKFEKFVDTWEAI